MKKLSNFEKLALLKKNLALLKNENNDHPSVENSLSNEQSYKHLTSNKNTKPNMPIPNSNPTLQHSVSSNNKNLSKVYASQLDDKLDRDKSDKQDMQKYIETKEQQEIAFDDDYQSLGYDDLLKQYELLKDQFDKLSSDLPTCCDDYCDAADPFTNDKQVNSALFDAGISKEQAKIVFSLAKEILFDITSAIGTEYAKAFEEAKSVNYFKGKDNYQIIKEKIKNWAVANIGLDAYEKLNESHDGRLAIYKLLQKSNSHGLDLSDNENNTEMNVAKLREMMKQPSYWLKKDPTIMKKVQTGFKRLYSKSEY